MFVTVICLLMFSNYIGKSVFSANVTVYVYTVAFFIQTSVKKRRVRSNYGPGAISAAHNMTYRHPYINKKIKFDMGSQVSYKRSRRAE